MSRKAMMAVLLLLLLPAMVPAAIVNVVGFRLSVKRVGDKAVGTIDISNPTKDPITIGKIPMDIRFSQFCGLPSCQSCECHKDDIRQQLDLPACGTQQFPLTLAPGAQVSCPIESRENIYKGSISVVARAVKVREAGAPDYLRNSDILGFAVETLKASSTAAPQGQSSAGSTGPVAAGNQIKYTATANANIQGSDISCGHKTSDNKAVPFCKICGGKAAVEAACNKQAGCVAYDMEGSSCGYLKASKTTIPTRQPGFVSYARA